MEHYFRYHRNATHVFLAFLSASFLIIILHLTLHPVRVLGMDTSIFYMDEKYTLAAFFSTVTAFLTGMLALMNAGSKGKPSMRWPDIAFGVFFIILAFDEYFEVHEYTNTMIKSLLAGEGIAKTLATFSWVFPLAAIIIGVFALVYLKIQASVKEVKGPLMAGIVCVAAILILELFGSATYGKDIYVYLVAAEEGLEMIGVSLFLLAVLVEKGLSDRAIGA